MASVSICFIFYQHLHLIQLILLNIQWLKQWFVTQLCPPTLCSRDRTAGARVAPAPARRPPTLWVAPGGPVWTQLSQLHSDIITEQRTDKNKESKNCYKLHKLYMMIVHTGLVIVSPLLHPRCCRCPAWCRRASPGCPSRTCTGESERSWEAEQEAAHWGKRTLCIPGCILHDLACHESVGLEYLEN